MKLIRMIFMAWAILLVLPTNAQVAQTGILANERDELAMPRAQGTNLHTAILQPEPMAEEEPVQTLRPKPKSPALQLSREPVVFSQWLGSNPNRTLLAKSISLQSRSYTLLVDGRALQKGVPLMTDAGGALVMLSKSGTKNPSSNLRLKDIEIGSSVGQMKASDQAMSLGAEISQLKQLQPELFGQSMAFKLAPQLGHGELILRAKSAPANERFVIHVYDKNSKHALQAQYQDANLPQGGVFTFSSNVTGVNLKHAEAQWVYADGTRLNAKLQQNGKAFRVSVPNRAHAPGELVTLKMKTRTSIAGKQIWRDIDLPINPQVKTAQLAGTPTLKRVGHRYWISVPIHATGESRFEVRALIGNGNKNNRLYYSANYFSPGSATLNIELEPSQVALAEQGQLILKELQLLDQGQLAVLSNLSLNQPLALETSIRQRMDAEIQQF